MTCPKCGIENYRELKTKIYDGDAYKWVVKCNSCGAMFTKPVVRAKIPTRYGKRIVQFKDGKPIGYYRSIREASKNIGLAESTISNCLTGRTKTAGGYEWGYDRRKFFSEDKEE